MLSATKRINLLMNWSDKKTVQKGDFAEAIIHEFLESKGYVVYKPVTDSAHPFDKLAIRDKRNVIIAEVKAKAKRNYFPDTGIDVRHYNDYIAIMEKHNIPVFIFFVDEMLGEIYGNFLSRLEREVVCECRGKELKYPREQNGIIYFHMDNMQSVKKLTEAEIQHLKHKSERGYEYLT